MKESGGYYIQALLALVLFQLSTAVFTAGIWLLVVIFTLFLAIKTARDERKASVKTVIDVIVEGDLEWGYQAYVRYSLAPWGLVKGEGETIPCARADFFKNWYKNQQELEERGEKVPHNVEINFIEI